VAIVWFLRVLWMENSLVLIP